MPVNRATFVAAATAPHVSIWLYGENDSYYTIAHSQASFDAFVAAGGKAMFKFYRRSNPTANGHFILSEPALWQSDLLLYLAQLPR